MSYKADSDTDASSRNSKLYRGKAPIASMDAMEDMDLLSGSNTHLSKLSSDGNMAASVGATAVLPSAPAFVNALPAGTKVAQSERNTIFPGIKYRNIGKTGLKCSNIGLGSIKVFDQESPEAAEEIVTLAYESGINYFDICDPYRADEAERQLGRILKTKGWPRRNYVISTKVYWHKNDLQALSRKEIIESVKISLINLGLEYIDLVIVHKYDHNCPVEEVVRAMTFLIDAGMVMYWGTARWTPFEIFESYSASKEYRLIGPTVELSEYHWFHREKVELYMAELYNKIGVGLMTWSPISYGLSLGNKEDNTLLFQKLSIKNYKSQPPSKAVETVMLPPETSITMPNQPTSIPGIAPTTSVRIPADGSATPAGVTTVNSTGPMDVAAMTQSRIKLLTKMADKHGCTLSQLAVAWCLRNSTSQSVIASANSTEQLLEILGSLPIVAKITHPVNEEIDKILGNKPARQPMVSTLQTRWAATGGVPPC